MLSENLDLIIFPVLTLYFLPRPGRPQTDFFFAFRTNLGPRSKTEVELKRSKAPKDDPEITENDPVGTIRVRTRMAMMAYTTCVELDCHCFANKIGCVIDHLPPPQV